MNSIYPKILASNIVTGKIHEALPSKATKSRLVTSPIALASEMKHGRGPATAQGKGTPISTSWPCQTETQKDHY